MTGESGTHANDRGAFCIGLVGQGDGAGHHHGEFVRNALARVEVYCAVGFAVGAKRQTFLKLHQAD